MLQLVDSFRRLPDKILHRVNIAEPIGTLYGVIEVPVPVVGSHVAQRSGDPALRGNGVRAGREKLGDASGAQSLFGHAERCSETRSAGPHDNHIIDVIGELIRAHAGCRR